MNTARKWRRRLLAVLLGLAVFPAVEIICRLAGWGEAVSVADPYVGFAGVRPLFEADLSAGVYRTADNRHGFFAVDSFAIEKPEDEFRVFVFGGSTVQGRPFSIETAFSTFLEMSLQAVDASRRWQVVNCGGVSYASYRLIPLLQECQNYQPDLVILCSGHNEFLESVSYRQLRNTSLELPAAAYGWLSQLNSFRLVADLGQRSSVPSEIQEPVAVLPQEVDALLDHQGGLEAYNRDALQRTEVIRQFGFNLKRMIRMCGDADIPVLLLLPPSNLQDCPPFKSEFSRDTPIELQQQLLQQTREATELLTAGKAQDAVQLMEQVVRADPRFAFSWYRLGHALVAAGDSETALAAFERARDEDVCPLRMISSLEQTMRDVARETETPLIEIAPLLLTRAQDEIPGDAVLVDHIHPSFRGHQDIAVRLADWMIDSGFVDPQNSDWKTVAEKQFNDHLQSLENMYFLRGQRTLDSLRGWTQGRAEGPPLRLDP